MFRHTKAERIHHNQICTTTNDKGNYSSRRKIIGVGNLDLHKGIKSTSKSKYKGKHKDIFLLLEYL